MLILTSKSPSYGIFLWLEVQLGLPEPRLLYLEENCMMLVRSLGKGQNSRVMRASIEVCLVEGGVFELDGRFYDFCTGFQRNSRYCGLFFFIYFFLWGGRGVGVGG